jgi:hypothetical protein
LGWNGRKGEIDTRSKVIPLCKRRGAREKLDRKASDVAHV